MPAVTGVLPALEEIAVRVLGVRRADLAAGGLQDLGLNSVNAVRLVEEVNQRFDHDFPTSVVFEFADLAGLAAHVEATLAAGPVAPAGGARSVATGAPASTGPARRSAPRAGTGDAGQPVAIVGLGCRTAGADDADAYWELIREGRDALTELTDPTALALFTAQFPDTAPPRYGRLADSDAFDASFFRISPREAAAMDPAQRVLLQECYHALEDAGQDPAALRGRNVATVVGTTGLPPQTEYSAHALLGADGSIMAARLAYHLDLNGPALAVDTACSSSMVALDIAHRLVRSGEADLALAAGVTVFSHPGTFATMEALGSTSPSRQCRPFDTDADGMVLGEGVGVVVLKRLDDALRDRDRIYGVVRGIGTNQDGRTSGITAPSFLAQSRLMREVYQRGGIDPDRIQYVETHGTGTKLGDPVEIHGLTRAFAEFTERTRFCAIGSVKANIGHTTAAAGILGVIKVLLALRHRQLPPATNFARENEHIDFATSPVYVNRTLSPWPENDGGPRLAAVSSFGYSGTNGHVVLAEHVERVPAVRARPRRAQLVPLSATSAEQLHRKADALHAYLTRTGLGDDDLGDVAYTLQTGREAMPVRAAVVAASMAELTDRLRGYADGRPTPGVHTGTVDGDVPQGDGYGLGPDELAAGWCTGLAVDWPRLHTGAGPRRISLPTHPFEQVRYPARTEPVPVAGPRPGAVPSVLPDLDRAAAAYLRENHSSTSLAAAARSVEVTTELNELCRHRLYAAYRRMGVLATPGERWTARGLIDHLGVVEEHHILHDALLNILVDLGALRREEPGGPASADQAGGDTFVTTDRVAELDARTEPARLERDGVDLVASFPDLKGFLRLLTACTEALGDILTGRRKAHEVLFPGGSFEALEDVYHANEETNALVARLLAGYVAARLATAPDARVTLVEVGAGTGGTSARVLPALAPYGEHLRYVYTDISRSFTQFGSRRYGADHPFAEFTPLDIESAPTTQGFTAASADVVLAANVLHATSDIDRTLAHVREVLRPGGLLVLMEATAVQEYYTLTFGLTAGWWNAVDGRRLPDSPLLDVAGWRQAVERAGFRSVRAWPLLPFREDQAPEIVLVAELDGAADRVPATAAPDVGAAPSATPSAPPAPPAPGTDLGAYEGNHIAGLVARAWCEVLGVTTVGPDDDFQELGGDSILATQIISRLRGAFPVELELGELFQATTVTQMASLMEAELIERIDELPEETVRELLV